MTNILKDNWNSIDERCPQCNSVTKEAKGFNKQNLKKLCFSKPSTQDLIILVMLILCLLMGFSYLREVNAYKEIIANPQEICSYYYYNSIYQNPLNEKIVLNGSDYK